MRTRDQTLLVYKAALTSCSEGADKAEEQTEDLTVGLAELLIHLNAQPTWVSFAKERALVGKTQNTETCGGRTPRIF